MISANVWNEGDGQSVLSQKQYDTGRLGKNLCPKLFLKIETERTVTMQAGSLFPKRLIIFTDVSLHTWYGGTHFV